jgi:hypothetical protein
MKDMADNNQYMVVLGDIRNSRLEADRNFVQIGLRQLLETVNVEVASSLRVPFSISSGDEVQAVLQQPCDLYRVIDNLDLNTSLFSLRFGVGWGQLSTDFAPRSWEMDGECFHAARHALERAKDEDRWVAVQGVGEQFDRALEATFRLVQIVREGWTKKQRLAVSIRKTRITQKASAEAMGLDQSTLSKMLTAAHYKELVEMERAFGGLLDLGLRAPRTVADE